MTKRPSLRELFGVWFAGVVGEIASYYVVESAGPVITTLDLAAGLLFLVSPGFLVAYTLIWAWPSSVMGDRTVAALLVFGLVIEASAVVFSAVVDAVTNTAVMIRLLAVVSPMLFGAYAICAAWASRRQVVIQSDCRTARG